MSLNLETGSAITKISRNVLNAALVNVPFLAQMSTEFETSYQADTIKVPSFEGLEDSQEVRERNQQNGQDQNGKNFDSFQGAEDDITFVDVKADQEAKIEMTIKERHLEAASRTGYQEGVSAVKGHALAKILTNGFFAAIDLAEGGPAYLGSADSPEEPVNYPFSTFDGDMLIDVEDALDASSDFSFPNLFLKRRYKHALRKSKSLFPAENVANLNRDAAVIQEINRHNDLLLSFAKYVPDPRGQNLSGMAFDKYAIAAATMPGAMPDSTSSTNYLTVEKVTDEHTGLTMMVKAWHNPDESEYRLTFQLYYGFKLLSPNRIKLLRTANPAG